MYIFPLYKHSIPSSINNNSILIISIILLPLQRLNREAEKYRKEMEEQEMIRQQMEQQAAENKKNKFMQRVSAFNQSKAPSGEEVVQKLLTKRDYEREFNRLLEEDPDINPLALELKLKAKYNLNGANKPVESAASKVPVPLPMPSGGNYNSRPAVSSSSSLKPVLQKATSEFQSNSSNSSSSSNNQNISPTAPNGATVRVVWEEVISSSGVITYNLLTATSIRDNSDMTSVVGYKGMTRRDRPDGVAIIAVDNARGEEENWQEYVNLDYRGVESTCYYNHVTQEVRNVKPVGGFKMIIETR